MKPSNTKIEYCVESVSDGFINSRSRQSIQDDYAVADYRSYRYLAKNGKIVTKYKIRHSF